MGKLIIFILLLFCCNIISAQDTSFIPPKKYTPIQGSFTDFEVDNVGNIYIVINHQQLKKLNEKGDSVAVYNDVKRYGKISSVDVSNPFKILVFYKDAATIVILDRLLSIKNTIDLRRSGFPQVSAVRLSYDNNIWFYDELEARVRKIDDNGKPLMESADLRVAFTEAPSVQSIFDDNRSLYLYDKTQGWFVFDYYGALIKKYAFINWKDVQLVNGMMIGRSDSSLYSAKPNDFDFKEKKLAHITSLSRKLLVSSKKLYVLGPGNLEIYDAL
jgi:hypothetical protein